jgi:hypothetical protein
VQVDCGGGSCLDGKEGLLVGVGGVTGRLEREKRERREI